MSVAAAVSELPAVRLEVHQAGRSVPYFFDQVDFLVGTVAGCDLRVPGTDLPAVLCLLARHPGGVSLRRLAPTQILLLNGASVSRAELKEGDRLTLGSLDIYVHVEAAANLAASTSSAVDADEEVIDIEKERADLEAERDALLRERDGLLKQIQQAPRTVPAPSAAMTGELLQRELALDRRDEELTRQKQTLDAQTAEVEKQRQEIAGVRQELSDIRQQLYDRYQERRDRLAGLQEAVNHAAKKVQEAKRDLEQSRLDVVAQRERFTREKTDAEQIRTSVDEERALLEAERQAFGEAQRHSQEGLATKTADLAAREDRLASQRQTLEARERQYQDDVLRLDRRQGEVERREKQLAIHGDQIHERAQQLDADGADLEQQAHDLDQLRTQLHEESARLEKQKHDQDARETQLHQRAAMLEGQQASVSALRGKLERMRDDLRQQEVAFEEQRQAHDRSLQDAARKEHLLDQRQLELDGQAEITERDKQQVVERQAVLAAAIAKLKEAQDRTAAEEQTLHRRDEELREKIAAAEEKEALLQGRLDQLAQTQSRLDQERQALRVRTQELTQAEQARTALQEQLRRRGEELAEKQKQLSDHLSQVQEKETRLTTLKSEIESATEAERTALATQASDLATQSAEVERRHGELTQLELLQRRQIDELHEKSRQLADQERALAEQQSKNQQHWQQQQDEHERRRVELLELQRQAKELLLELPDLELKAGTTLDRLSHGREQWRDSLAELHGYVRQSHEELSAARARLEHDHASLRQKEQELRRLQDEHRVALASFRQQLIDWQGQIAELHRLLKRDERGLENRQAKVEAQAQKLDAAAEGLARESAVLEVQQRVVAEQRQELDHQYGDLRDWYRRKMRELAGVPLDASGEPAEVTITREMLVDDEAPLIPVERDILSLTGPIDPGDQTLGERLRAHQLIDGDSLHALLVEARRQRRSLRQVLMASGAVTAYQLALIETGHVEGLMVGPYRVIDRIRQSPHETVYRIFDPRRGQEAVLRHLGEAYSADAVVPDEYRQRFQQLIVPDAHLAATLDVVDIDGRPAVVQEWLTGLPASDWPPLAAAPGVCYRLLTQAALGLDALHRQGLIHGRLAEPHLLLTPQGLLKLCGAGEPAWLTGATEGTSDSSGDLRALGRIVSGWCTPSGVRKGPKAKPLPERMVAILFKMQATPGYTSARELLDDLDAAAADVPANPEAWDRLVRYVRDHAMPEPMLRQSA